MICFQEIITTKEVGYIEKIASSTKLKNYVFFELSPCSIIKNTNCGLAILSKYEILDCKTELFPNPMIAKTTKSGNTYYTYDKGMLSCNLNVNGKTIKVMTHHGFPFRRFDSVPENHLDVFEYFDNTVSKLLPDIVTGDFNTEKFMKLMEYTRHNYKNVFDEVTTVDERKFDNILFRDINKYEKKVIKLLSDHFMIAVDVEI